MTAIEVTDLTFAYGDLKVLDGISFEVPAGELAAFVGPSGCGKSTLLRCLAGLLSPSSGDVRLYDGSNPSRNGLCSFVFQMPTLLPWLTVHENLALPFEISGVEVPSEAIGRQLRDLGLEHFENSFPSQLSVGMAQRVAFARALSENRPILLLDEPYSGLDELTKRTLAAFLSCCVSERRLTAILVTHSLHDATFLADRVFVLSDRPARIKKQIRIAMEQPRSSDLWLCSQLLTYMDEARRALESEDDRACFEES